MKEPETFHSDKLNGNDTDQPVFWSYCPELEKAHREGVDLWALWANLQRTPLQRIERHQIALDLYRKLSKAKSL